MDTVQSNEQCSQKSLFPVFFFAITLHLMMKHRGILCNKKAIEIHSCCAVSNDPRGEFCFLFAVAQNVTQQRPAPGRQDNNTCDMMESKHREQREQREDNREERGDKHVIKRKSAKGGSTGKAACINWTQWDSNLHSHVQHDWWERSRLTLCASNGL